MSRTRYVNFLRGGILCLVFLCIPSASALAQDTGLPGEEQTGWPAAAVDEWAEHAGGGAEVFLSEDQVVEVDLASLQPEPAMLAPVEPQSHMQGEFIQNGEQEFTLRAAAPEEPPAGLPEEMPEGGAMAAAAPGQNVASFDGKSYTGWYPPDTILGVGPQSIVEAVNSGFIVYSKSGAVLKGYTTFSNFFSSVQPSPWAGNHFDPRVLYSQVWGKFVMLVLGRDTTNQNSFIFVAISQTSDPTGKWWLWRFTADWGTHSGSWLDYAGLGADPWGLYFTGNYFRWAGGFQYAMIWSVNPAIFSGGAANGWQFWDLKWPNGSKAFTVQPANPHSNNSNQQTFFVNTFSSSGNQILLWRLSGDRTSSPSLSKAATTITAYDAIGNTIVQKGSSTDIDGGDCRVQNAVYSQHRVYATLGTDPPKNGTASGFIVTKLNTDTTSVDWQSLVWSGTGQYYFYPAVTINGGSGTSPNIGVYHNWSNSSRFVSGVYRITQGDTLLSWVSFISGEAAYVRLDGSGRNRWGDYSGAAFDWSSGATPTMWGAVEYAGTSNQWKTRIKGVTMQ